MVKCPCAINNYFFWVYKIHQVMKKSVIVSNKHWVAIKQGNDTLKKPMKYKGNVEPHA
jgi:hypothetical protein